MNMGLSELCKKKKKIVVATEEGSCVIEIVIERLTGKNGSEKYFSIKKIFFLIFKDILEIKKKKTKEVSRAFVN